MRLDGAGNLAGVRALSGVAGVYKLRRRLPVHARACSPCPYSKPLLLFIDPGALQICPLASRMAATYGKPDLVYWLALWPCEAFLLIVE